MLLTRHCIITCRILKVKPKGQAVLFPGDLSYADDHPNHDQRKWDSWGRFVEPCAAYQPFIYAAGNHEIDFVPNIVSSHNN